MADVELGFSQIFEPQKIEELLSRTQPSVNEIIDLMQQDEFNIHDLSRLLLAYDDQTSYEAIFQRAVIQRIEVANDELYRMPPVYIANGEKRLLGCIDSCKYCPFHRGIIPHEQIVNLTVEETKREVSGLINMGYGDVELVAATVSYLLKPEGPQGAARYVKAAKEAGAQHVGINFFPLGRSEYYRILKDAGLDFTIVWQETYNRQVYEAVHAGGPKANMNYRLDVNDRAIRGGIETVGLAFLRRACGLEI